MFLAAVSMLLIAFMLPPKVVAPSFTRMVRLLEASNAPVLFSPLAAFMDRLAELRLKLPLPSTSSYSSPAISLPLLSKVPPSSTSTLPRAERNALFSISLLLASMMISPPDVMLVMTSAWAPSISMVSRLFSSNTILPLFVMLRFFWAARLPPIFIPSP